MSDAERATLPDGWYINLHGEKRDLETWVQHLPNPQQHSVWIDGPEWYVLGGGCFSGAVDWRDVDFKAGRLLDELSVSMAISNSTLPVSFSGVFRVTQGAKAHLGELRLSRSSLTERPERKGLAIQDLKSKEVPDKVRVLLHRLSHATDWDGIYRTQEIIEKMLNSKALKMVLGDQHDEYKTMMSHANLFRHEINTYTKPSRNFQRDIILLRSSVRKVLPEIR